MFLYVFFSFNCKITYPFSTRYLQNKMSKKDPKLAKNKVLS